SPLYFTDPDGQVPDGKGGKTKEPKGSTVFWNLLTKNDANPPVSIPSAAQTMQSITGFSPFFEAAKVPRDEKGNFTYPTLCNDTKLFNAVDGARDKYNLACALELPEGGQCCPDVNGAVQGCCDYGKFILDGVTRTFPKDATKPVTNEKFVFQNDVLADLVKR